MLSFVGVNAQLLKDDQLTHDQKTIIEATKNLDEANKLGTIKKIEVVSLSNFLHPDEKLEKATEMMDEVVESWGNRKFLCHVSSQGEGQIGHHADYIDSLPIHMLKIPERYRIDIDIEVEAKMKEKAIFKLKKQYPELF